MKKFVFALILVYFFYIFVQAQEKNIIVTPEKMEGVTGTRWAFIAAVDDYAEVRGLNYTVNDALDLKRKLIELGFLEQNIVCLTSGAKFRDLPTKSNIEEQFAALLTRVGAGDMILVYLSGHGVEIKGEEGSFFCPPETDPKRLKETTVSINQMMDDLDKNCAKFKWMVVDACRNDPKNPEKSLFSDRDAGAKELESVMDPPEAVTLLQSCQPKKRSYEGGIGKAAKIHNGFFTLSLLEALSLTGDVNEDSEVTFSEVFQYVSRSTNEMAGRYYGEVQIPNLTGNVTDFVFLRDKNLPKAEKLASQAQSRLDAKDFEAASEQINQALALCPRVRRFRDLKEKIEDAAPVVLREITVPTDVATLAEAYAKIAPQGTITLLRGRYKVPETITITKNVTIFGDVTHPEYVVLEGGETNVFNVQSGFAEIAGLTIQNEGKEGSFDVSNAVVWVSTPLCAFHDCVFTSRFGCGFIVNTKDSAPDVQRCTARNCGQRGFYIGSGASGTFRDCTASGNAYPGLAVKGEGSNPTVEGCTFTKNKQNGVWVYESAGGTFRKNQLSENGKSAWNIAEGCKVVREENTPNE